MEECFTITIGVLQHRFGRKPLLEAAKELAPLNMPIPQNPPAQIWLTSTMQRVPKRHGKFGSMYRSAVRLWFACPKCWRRVGKLFYWVEPQTLVASEVACRKCHNLAYQSANSKKNRWWCEVARPARQLLREKWRLLARRKPDMARLLVIDAQLRAHRERVRSKGPSVATGKRRPYRDVSVLE